MEEPKRGRAEERAHVELLTCLAAQERWLRTFLEAGNAVPVYRAISGEASGREIEIEIDADVMKWFRALGPIHEARINAVLRAYAREMWKPDSPR